MRRSLLEGQELESRQLLTGVEGIGPAAAGFVAQFGTDKLEEKLDQLFCDLGESWTGPFSTGIEDAGSQMSGIPRSERFDPTVGPASDVISTQILDVGALISGTQTDLSFPGGFGFGENVTHENYEGGVLVSGTKGASDILDFGGYWYTGGEEWTNPNPAAGVALDKVVTNASVSGYLSDVQGEVSVIRTLEMTNGDKKNYTLNATYFGNDDWIVNGSVTRKVGDLTLTAYAHGTELGFEE